jgi:hypothetical protein
MRLQDLQAEKDREENREAGVQTWRRNRPESGTGSLNTRFSTGRGERLVAELLDIFGNYCRHSSWHAVTGDIRNEVFQQYQQALSPARCREIWEQLRSGGATESTQEETDHKCSIEYARRIVGLQNYVDTSYALINSAFGSNSQGFATFLGNLVEQYSVILAANTAYWTSQALVMEKPGSTGGMLTRLAHPMQLEPMLDYARRVRLFIASL